VAAGDGASNTENALSSPSTSRMFANYHRDQNKELQQHTDYSRSVWVTASSVPVKYWEGQNTFVSGRVETEGRVWVVQSVTAQSPNRVENCWASPPMCEREPLALQQGGIYARVSPQHDQT
jgi:hypothetical protein